MADEGAAPDPGQPDAAQLQGLLDEARAEIEQLERDTADASARAYRAASEADELRAALDEANGRVDAASVRERDAAVRYRELALRAEPELPAEMIAGDTVEAIDASIVTAREVVTRVRSHIEAQAQAARVPAGAPQRGERDLSGLSPQQKIRFGLEQRAQAS